MISFEKKTESQPLAKEADRIEPVRKAVAERRDKSATDGTRRRARQTAEDDRLL